MAVKPTYNYGDQYKKSKDLPRDQQKLAQAAAEGTGQKQDITGFLNKGITSFLGGAVDFATGAMNDMETFRSKTSAPVEKLLGMESKPPNLLDPANSFGGTASVRRGFENAGVNIPDREAEGFAENFAEGTGGLGSFIIPQLGASKLLGTVNKVVKGGSFNPYDESTNEPSDQASAPVVSPTVSPTESPVVNQAEKPTFTYGDQYSTNATPANPVNQVAPAEAVAPAAPVPQAAPVVPMTGLRPIDPQTGEPLSQGSIDAISGAGYALPQASVPLPYEAPKTERELAVAAGEARNQAFRDGAPASDNSLIATGQMEAPEGYYNRPPQPTEAPAPANSQVNDRVDGMSDLGAKMNADFVRFQRSGREMTPEMKQKADELALSVGRTFDPVAGYSPDFSPELMEEFNRRVEAGIINPSGLGTGEGQSSQSRPQDSSSTSPQGSPELSSYEQQSLSRQQRIGGTGSYEGDSRQMQDKLNEESTFLDTKYRVMGEMVSDNPENRKLRNQEALLKAQGKEAGYRGWALRGFVENGMRANADVSLDRTQEEEDRATQKIMDDLNISTAQASLALKKAKQLEVPKLPIGTVKAVLGTLAENGISYDLDTGALTTADERFMLPDGTVNLSPNSAVYKLLEGVEGAEAFFAAPPSVEAKKSDAKEGQIVKADDGRIYRFVGGEFVHIL